ncbi:31 kDa ribonucleoprotein, chloroplastic [Phoenix dactylifera]|uniref:31 kDa ribonucleoprotein, chloroplastic n=1 Tax=Phoenix dactylifera TaxID=42345 RepID=A0A8B7C0W6_PHODC|nr:31 kDa ribonucleoprotein, chloroplastic [Phoenix dactylifera]
MAATAAVGSYFSTAATPQLSSKLVSSDAVLRLTCARPSRMPTITILAEHFSTPVATSQKWRLLRISAAVAQEEATAEVQEEEAEEEKETMEEGGKEEEVVVATPAPQNTKLYFGNLPYNCDSAQLAGIIQQYANPEMVEVLYDRDTGRSRGFAFVTMSSVEDCEAVIQNLDGSQYSGRTLRVNFSDKPKPKEPLYPETDYKLFVGNLSWSVTSESLTQVFQDYGNVVGARVLYDGDSGRSRGYGFVCYSTKEEMDAALQYLNGAELEGRAMRVSLALGKKS